MTVGTGSYIHPTSVIGYVPNGEGAETVIIGSDVEIGAFCVIEAGVKIGDRVRITHRCVVGAGAEIGDGTLLVDSLRIDARARIGQDCVIGGNVPDRAVVADRVTMMGEMSHSYSNAEEPWGVKDEISPIILAGTVVAQGVQVIGGIVIGAGCYIATGEIVRSDVAPGTLVSNGRRMPIEAMRGLIRARERRV